MPRAGERARELCGRPYHQQCQYHRLEHIRVDGVEPPPPGRHRALQPDDTDPMQHPDPEHPCEDTEDAEIEIELGILRETDPALHEPGVSEETRNGAEVVFDAIVLPWPYGRRDEDLPNPRQSSPALERDPRWDPANDDRETVHTRQPMQECTEAALDIRTRGEPEERGPHLRCDTR